MLLNAMFVRHLSVADFRSWASAELALEPGPTVLVGAERAGQDQPGRGARLPRDPGQPPGRRPTRRWSAPAPSARSCGARVVADGRELRVELEITPGRANRARLNGVAAAPAARRARRAARACCSRPEDLAIVRGDPSERRRFLDDLVVARSPRLAGVRADYERVLKQRRRC